MGAPSSWIDCLILLIINNVIITTKTNYYLLLGSDGHYLDNNYKM